MARTITGRLNTGVAIGSSDDPILVAAGAAIASSSIDPGLIAGPIDQPWQIDAEGSVTSVGPYGIAVLSPGTVSIGVSTSGVLVSGAIAGVVTTGGGSSIVNGGSINGTGLGAIWLQGAGSIVNGTDSNTTASLSGITSGVFAAASATIDNRGTIAASGGFGLIILAGASVNNGSATNHVATIQGAVNGIADFIGTGTLTNAGTISGTGAFGAIYAQGGTVANTGLMVGAWSGLYVTGGAAAVVNTGTILGSGLAGLWLDGSGGTVTNGTDQATGALVTGQSIGLFVSSGALALDNRGTITATGAFGAVLVAGGTLSNGSAADSAATISGPVDGLAVFSGATTLTNYGTISGAAAFGVLTAGGGTIVNATGALISGGAEALHLTGTTSVTNAGTLSGGVGLHLTGGTAGSVVANAGLIAGVSGRAVQFDDTATTLVLQAGAAFTGVVAGAGDSTLELAAGSGTLAGLGTAYTGFATLVSDSGTSWTVSGKDTVPAAGRLALAGSLALAPGATLDVEGGLAGGGTIDFGGAGTQTLVLGQAAAGGVALRNLGLGDRIDLGGVPTAGATAVLAGGTVTVRNGAGGTVATLGVGLSGAANAFAVGIDPANGDLSLVGATLADPGPVVMLSQHGPFVTATNSLALAGTAIDGVAPVTGLTVALDGGAPGALALSGGGFALDVSRFGVLNAGTHTLHFVATSSTGAIGTLDIPVVETAAPVGTALQVAAPSADGQLAAGAVLRGTASGGTGASVVRVSYAIDGGAAAPVAYDSGTEAFSGALDLSTLAAGPHTLRVTALDSAGGVATTTETLTLASAIPLTVAAIAPANGATEVGDTFRPRIAFSRAVDPGSVTASSVYATDASGAVIPATIVLQNGNTAAQLFFAAPLPSASTVTIHVVGSAIRAAAGGAALDAAGSGTPGSTLVDSFRTVSATGLAGTTLSGVIADPGPDLLPGSADDVVNNIDGTKSYKLPIAGVTVSILGTNISTTTDATGHYTLANIPAGDVKVEINGLTATNAPSGYYFPDMTMDTTIKPGATQTLMGSLGGAAQANANAIISGAYLPRVPTNALQAIGTTAPTVVMAPVTSAGTLTATQLGQLSVTVQPGSLIDANGKLLANPKVGIVPVPSSIVQDMLPPGLLQHTFDITIQAPGGAAFTQPASLTMPNVFGLAAGQRTYLITFNHTTGRLEISGTATASADGQTVTSDPGSVINPGWSGMTPPASIPTNSQGNVNGVPALPPPGCDTGTYGKAAAAEQTDYLGLINQVSTYAQAAGTLGKIEMSERGTGVLNVLGVGMQAQATRDHLDANLDDVFRNGQPADYARTAVEFIKDSSSLIVDIASAVGGKFPGAGKVLGEIGNVGGGLIQLTNDLVDHYQNQASDASALSTAAAGWNAAKGGGMGGGGAEGDGGATPSTPLDVFLARLAADNAELLAEKPILAQLAADVAIGAELDGIDPSKPNGGLSDAAYAKLNADLPQIRAALKDAAAQFQAFYGYRLPQIIAQDEIDAQAAFQQALGMENFVAANPVNDLARAKNDLAGLTTTAGNADAFAAANAKVAAATQALVSAYGAADATLYASFISDGGPVSRFQYKLSTGINYVLNPTSNYVLQVWDPLTGMVGTSYFKSAAAGSPTTIPTPTLYLDKSAVGIDGLTATEAAIVGVDNTIRSNIQPGVTDLAAIQQGAAATSLATALGVVGALAFKGEATAVALPGSVGLNAQQIAYIATGSYGLAIADVTDPLAPNLLGQIALPGGGTATGVAVDDATGLLGVADNAGGLQIFDVSNPALPVAVATAPLLAAHVVARNGLFYVASQGALAVVDARTGQVLQTVRLGTSTLTGLAIDRTTLYSMDAAFTLRSFAISPAGIAQQGSLVLSAGGNGITVAGGVAYVGAAAGYSAGYLTVDVSNPAAPKLIEGIDSYGIQSAAIALTGAGLGLGVGLSSSGSGVVVFNAASTSNTGQVVTRYTLPAIPTDVAIAGGVAYVADGTGGLQVVNYLASGAGGALPTANFSRLPATVATVASGIAAYAGEPISLSVSATAGSGVRNVELLVNGLEVANDVSYPFDFTTTLPTLAAAGAGTVTVQAMVVDGAGNTAFTAPLTVTLASETAALALVSQTIAAGQQVTSDFRSIDLTFNRPLDPATVTASTFALLDPSGNAVAPLAISLLPGGREVRIVYGRLAAAGGYTEQLVAAGIRDTAGNALGASTLATAFTLLPYSTTWLGAGPGAGSTGDWNVPGNWSSGAVPIASDVPLIQLARGAVLTVTPLSSGTIDAVGGFALQGAGTLLLSGNGYYGGATLAVGGVLDVQGGTLDLGSQGQYSNGYYVTRSVLSGATLESHGGTIAFDGGSLSSVTFVGTLNPGAGSLYAKGLTLEDSLGATHGSLQLTQGGTISFSETATLLDNVGIALGDRAALDGTALTLGAHGTITVGTGAANIGTSFTNLGTVSVASASVGGVYYTLARNPLFANAGLITLNQGASFNLDPGGGNSPGTGKAWSNSGTIFVGRDSTLVAGASYGGFANTGTIVVDPTGTVALRGTLALGDIKNIGGGGHLAILGNSTTLDLGGGTLDAQPGGVFGNLTLGADTGDARYAQVPHIQNGTISEDGATVDVRWAFLNNVTVLGTLRPDHALYVSTALAVLPAPGSTGLGTIDLRGGQSINFGTYSDKAAVTLDHLSILMGAGSTIYPNTYPAQLTASSSLTQTGAGVTIGLNSAGTLNLTSGSATLYGVTNTGTIVVSGGDDVTAGSYSTGTGLTNSGLVTVLDGKLRFYGGTKATNSGTIAVGAGTLFLGAGLANTGTISVSPAGTLDVTASTSLAALGAIGGGGTLVVDAGATLNLGGATLDLGASGPFGAAILNGTIRNGTLRFDGGRLVTNDGGSLDTITTIGGSTTLSASVQSGTTDLAGGTLTLAANTALEVDGTVRNGTIALAGGTLSVGNGYTSPVFDGVTILGPLGPLGTFSVTNGLRVRSAAGAATGTIDLRNTTMAVADSETLDQVTIIAGNYGNLVETANGGTLTLGAAATLDHRSGPSSLGTGTAPNSAVVNLGSIHVGHDALSLNAPSIVNSGTITVDGGAQLVSTSGALTNSGLVSIASGAVFQTNGGALAGTGSIAVAPGGTFEVDGTLALADLAGVANAGTLSVVGTLDLAGGTLDVKAGTSFGTVAVPSGTLRGGTLLPDGGTLALGAATLDGITLGAALRPTAGSVVSVANGLSFAAGANTIDLRAGGSLVYAGSQTADNATFLLGAAGSNASLAQLGVGGNDTLTLGAGVQIVQRGGAGTLNGSYGGGASAIVSNATMDLAGGTLALGGAITDAGLIRLGAGEHVGSYGGTLAVASGGSVAIGSDAILDLTASGFANAGSVSIAAGGTLVVGSGSLSTLGAIDNAGLLTIAGTLDLGGGTLDVAPGGAFAHVLLTGGLTNGTLRYDGGVFGQAGTATLTNVVVTGAGGGAGAGQATISPATVLDGGGGAAPQFLAASAPAPSMAAAPVLSLQDSTAALPATVASMAAAPSPLLSNPTLGYALAPEPTFATLTIPVGADRTA